VFTFQVLSYHAIAPEAEGHDLAVSQNLFLPSQHCSGDVQSRLQLVFLLLAVGQFALSAVIEAKLPSYFALQETSSLAV